MKLSEWIDRVFYEEYWAICFRTLTERQSERLTCDTRTHAFTLLAPPAGAWTADPFLFADGDERYLFCEIVQKHHKKGVIGCAKWENGSFTVPTPVLTLPCHTSYPAVFRAGDEVFMIPETRASNTVELYRAVDFPTQWTHECTLLSGRPFVDTTPLIGEDGIRLFLYEPDDARNMRTLYLASFDQKTRTLGALTPVAAYRARLGRPAGLMQNTVRGDIRPTQHSINRYGERIVYKRLDFEKGYAEYDVATLSPASIRLDKKRKLLGVHTVNRAGDLEVIDVFYRRFMAFRPLTALLARLKVGRQ